MHANALSARVFTTGSCGGVRKIVKTLWKDAEVI